MVAIVITYGRPTSSNRIIRLRRAACRLVAGQSLNITSSSGRSWLQVGLFFRQCERINSKRRRQLILYITELGASATRTFAYDLTATMPVTAVDGGAEASLYYEPEKRTRKEAQQLVVAQN